MDEDLRYKRVHSGNGTTVFTIGYEKRSGDDVISELIDAGVDLLVDVRERPMSRKTDFRKEALRNLCFDANVEYESWIELGSTTHQRNKLRETGDFGEFRRRFKDFVKRNRAQAIARLSRVARKKQIALLCYERSHEECHRSVIAELLADKMNATVIAIT